MRALIPMRHGVIKRYFDKYKMQKSKRTEILAAAEESEAFIKNIMGKEYVHFVDAIPEIKEFMQEHEKKESVKLEDKQSREGTKIAKLVDLKSFYL